MNYRSVYTAYTVMNRAANDNTIPRKLLIKKILVISMLVGPIIALLLWSY
ncbi:MAG: hypothetical protein NTX76_03665 [Alphaproteobacteria bacterium]|nr:hypothetical protein [Alphaproteobacteria bacterium]